MARIDRRWRRGRMRRPLGLALALIVAGAGHAAAATQTIITTYQYDADGAPTAVTTTGDAQPAVTSYFTWDNFTPNSDAPTSGTVSAADGNLIAVGPTPGSGAAQFSYDVRDRLIACRPLDRPATSYAYDPVNLMSTSTLASGDALQFYYDDDSSAAALMINTRQSSTGLTDSFLGRIRYLSDGSEQALLSPRKDVAGVYDPSSATLTPYAYDPYGAATATSARPQISTSAQYDLSQNPFQYAGQYRDPNCGGAYYLRARWYLAKHQTFLSRDPTDAVHRYNYTAGNPIGRSDPSGLKFTGLDFSRDVDRAVGKLAPGIWAYLEPVIPVWGQALGGIQLVGMLPSFWHHQDTQGWITFGFLTASVASAFSEGLAELPQFDRLSVFSDRPDAPFGIRLGIDTSLGVGQTAAQSYRHGRIDVPSLIQGIDTTVYGMFWDRFVAGIGYRPHNLTATDVDRLALGFSPAASGDPGPLENSALVFLVRNESKRDYTTPWMEGRTIGHYHEYVLALTKHNALVSELEVTVGDTADRTAYDVLNDRRSVFRGSPAAIGGIGAGDRARLIGVFDAGTTGLTMHNANPLGLPTREEVQSMISRTGYAPESSYDRYSRNCHDHAQGVVRMLQRAHGR